MSSFTYSSMMVAYVPRSLSVPSSHLSRGSFGCFWFRPRRESASKPVPTLTGHLVLGVCKRLVLRDRLLTVPRRCSVRRLFYQLWVRSFHPLWVRSFTRCGSVLLVFISSTTHFVRCLQWTACPRFTAASRSDCPSQTSRHATFACPCSSPVRSSWHSMSRPPWHSMIVTMNFTSSLLHARGPRPSLRLSCARPRVANIVRHSPRRRLRAEGRCCGCVVVPLPPLTPPNFRKLFPPDSPDSLRARSLSLFLLGLVLVVLFSPDSPDSLRARSLSSCWALCWWSVSNSRPRHALVDRPVCVSPSVDRACHQESESFGRLTPSKKPSSASGNGKVKLLLNGYCGEVEDVVGALTPRWSRSSAGSP